MSREMPIPEAAVQDLESAEVFRAWVAERGLHCSIRIGMFEENGVDELRAWGILLSDVVRHISKAYSERYLADEDVILRKIERTMIEEIGQPTSQATGKFV